MTNVTPIYHDSDRQLTRVRRRKWLKRVATDPALSVGAFKCAYFLQEHYNDRYGVAWPSEQLLAFEVGVLPRRIRDFVRELVQAGWLIVRPREAPGGRGNAYALAVANRELDTMRVDEGDAEMQADRAVENDRSRQVENDRSPPVDNSDVRGHFEQGDRSKMTGRDRSKMTA